MTMNQYSKIKETIDYRALILENTETLIKSCSKKNIGQLSLFGEEQTKETIALKQPDNVDTEYYFEKESEVLGICLTYNMQDKYILHSKRFCNSSVRLINELTETKNNLVFIAKISDIEYKTSMMGNNYARIKFRDYDSELQAFLFGESYKNLISTAYKGRYYICECFYNNEKQSVSIVNFKPIEEVDILSFINTIILEVSDKYKIFELRDFIWNNMIGSDYDLIFSYDGEQFRAPYKIRFNEEIYQNLKPLIKDINVR